MREIVTGVFPLQRVNNAEMYSMPWRQNDLHLCANMREHHKRDVSIGLCYGFVTRGNKPSLEPILTQIFVAIRRH